MRAPSRRTVLAALAVSSLAVTCAPAIAGTTAKPKVVVFKAGVKSLPKSVAVGKVVTIDPRGTTVPKGDGVTSFTISYGDGTTGKHKGGLTPLKHAYKKAGTYRVTLVVTDKLKKTVRTTVKLVVTAPKPVASVVPTPTPTPTATSAPTPVKSPAPVANPDPTGPLSGIVKHNGTGVAGLLVVAVMQTQGSGSTVALEYRTTTTSDGAYALQTPAGSYTVYVDVDPDKVATAPNPAYSAEAVSATVAAGGSTTVPLSIDSAVTVTGVVQDTHGAAAPAVVDLDQYIGNADLEVEVATTSTGAYTISGASDTGNALVTNGNTSGISSLYFTPNSMYLQSADVEPDLTKSGGATAAQPVEQLADASVISGTVATPANIAAGKIDVTVLDSNGDDQGEAVTDSTGGFTIGQLAAGTYSVVADNPDSYEFASDYSTAYAYNTPLSVTTTTPAKTPVAAGKATLRTPGTITGTVTDAAGPVGDAYVYLTTADSVQFFATTDASGTYTLPGLPATTTPYTVDAGDSNNESGSTTAAVTAGGSTTADITIS